MARRTKATGSGAAKAKSGKPAGKPDTTKVGGAAPGTEDEAGKKSRRVDHPLVGNDDTSIYPFTEVPGDFDPSKHKGLKKRDFSADHVYFEYRAATATAAAEDFTAKAEMAKKLGSSKDRAKAKRLVKMQDKMSELRKQLEAQGVDVDALLTDDEE